MFKKLLNFIDKILNPDLRKNFYTIIELDEEKLKDYHGSPGWFLESSGKTLPGILNFCTWENKNLIEVDYFYKEIDSKKIEQFLNRNGIIVKEITKR